LGLKQPANGIARSRDEAVAVASRIGYPVLMRPSYVLGGRAMEIVDSQAQLDDYITTAVQVSGDSPVLIDQYLRDAIECDVDALCDGEQCAWPASCSTSRKRASTRATAAARCRPTTCPPKSSPKWSVRPMLALALGVKGLMNIQFAVKDGEVYLIEVNPRASRTVPFVAKALGQPVAKIAARVMAGEKLSPSRPSSRDLPMWRSRKRCSRSRAFPASIRCSARDEVHRRGHGHRQGFPHRLCQGPAGRGHQAAQGRRGVRLGQGYRQAGVLPAVRKLVALGFKLIATGGTARTSDHGVAVEHVNKVAEGRPHIVDKHRRWRCGADLQHHRGLAEPQGLAVDPPDRAENQGALLHHGRGKCGRCGCNRGSFAAKLEVCPLQSYYG
jgi:carbamoyl-phosphate synthase large subunit